MTYEKFSEKAHQLLDRIIAHAQEMPDGEREMYETEKETQAVILGYLRALDIEIGALISEAEEDAVRVR
jgi:hypothetical protein